MYVLVGELNDGNSSKFSFILCNFKVRYPVKLVDVWVIYWTIRINESQGSHFPVIEKPKNQNFSLAMVTPLGDNGLRES